MSKFSLLLFVIFSLLFFSCSTFVNLGDAETGSKNGESLPEELSDNENYDDSGNSGNSGEYGDSGDSSGDTGNTGNTGNTGDTGNSGNSAQDESDEYTPDSDFSESADEDSVSSGTYPFDDGFTSKDCSCGDDPAYEPTCCDGSISVFNPCFANCYNIHSNGRICVESTPGVCDKIEKPDNELSDTEISDTDTIISDSDALHDETDTDMIIDTDLIDDADLVDDTDITGIYSDEVNDADVIEIINNECGCYPDSTELYCCYVNGTVLVSKCMANCLCEGGYSNCY